MSSELRTIRTYQYAQSTIISLWLSVYKFSVVSDKRPVKSATTQGGKKESCVGKAINVQTRDGLGGRQWWVNPKELNQMPDCTETERTDCTPRHNFLLESLISFWR